MAEGKLKSVIDQIYTLDDIQQAHEFVETGQKKGSCSTDI